MREIREFDLTKAKLPSCFGTRKIPPPSQNSSFKSPHLHRENDLAH